ncbi:amidase signature (AS) enzyme-3 [Coleophoma cylindrospora]|uniref:Amidase signature (AS) enzyme-3 n=1 Tax=Coleophoma cylindrospora TaxID=1849047 RepID=A0A3D8RHX5_9HELO|nr:amidase signature (AS) enzyme-3 [Coleophoma cylindrospora]
MSVSVLGAAQQDSLVSAEEVTTLASKAGLTIPSANLDDWSKLLAGLNHCAKEILELPDYYPKVDFDLYPRENVHRPEGPEATDKGGWAWKATVKSTKPKSDTLKGVTIAIKDNIAVAGVKCTNGTGAVDWTPDVDATIITRILDAGGIITGKAACENNCFGAVSDTSVTGPVHNPYADGYSSGGSSSGSGRLVATGSVDMAIGADQGGSIRLPSANCGLVGLKPTWGLVPYTGCISLEATIDHAGPMCKTVQDCATLLEVIAGTDGIDDRQPYNWPQGHVKFGEEIKKHISNPDEQPLKGMKIGILEEGFQDSMTDPNVAAACQAAIEKYKSLGAEVKSISIPLHKESGMIWMVALPMAGTTQGLLANPTGRKQLLFPDRATSVGPKLSQEAFDALGPGGQNIYLRGLFLQERFGAPLHARCTNLLRKLADSYDAALREVDVLVTPTIIFPPVKIVPEGNPGGKLGTLGMLSRTIGATYNTATFNSTGHPGLNLPVGFVPARDDAKVYLPTGLQIVGSKFGDLTCLKIAASWEKNWNWKELKFEGN